jgi:hypothetical protein
MSQNPRLDLNIAPGYWRRVPGRQLVATLNRIEAHKLNDTTEHYVKSSLSELGLALYRHTLYDSFIVGFTSSHQHDHDRWLLTAHESNEGTLWLRACRENARRMTAHHSAVQAIADLAYYAGNLKTIARRSMPDSQALRRLQLVEFHVAAAAVLPEHLSLQAIHRMLHHYDRWAARNPEFKDIPQTIALRMHGFGPMLDAGYQLAGA